jgi:outer membrane protein assembly factor BamB
MVADFNKDGIKELLWCGAYHFGLTRLDGTVLWYKLGGAGMAGLGDIDGDGNLELGFAGWENGRGLCCFDAASGQEKWQWPIEGNPRAQVFSADINGDGRDEFIFAVGSTLYAVNGTGILPNLAWKVSLPAAPGELSFADVDGDGKTEIIFIGDDSTLYCLDRAR